MGRPCSRRRSADELVSSKQPAAPQNGHARAPAVTDATEVWHLRDLSRARRGGGTNGLHCWGSWRALLRPGQRADGCACRRCRRCNIRAAILHNIEGYATLISRRVDRLRQGPRDQLALRVGAGLRVARVSVVALRCIWRLAPA